MQSTLSNVAPYVYVAAGGKPAFPDGLAPSGTYNAESGGLGHMPLGNGSLLSMMTPFCLTQPLLEKYL